MNRILLDSRKKNYKANLRLEVGAEIADEINLSCGNRKAIKHSFVLRKKSFRLENGLVWGSATRRNIRKANRP